VHGSRRARCKLRRRNWSLHRRRQNRFCNNCRRTNRLNYGSRSLLRPQRNPVIGKRPLQPPHPRAQFGDLLFNTPVRPRIHCRPLYTARPTESTNARIANFPAVHRLSSQK
jgi:hypothetical protein